MRTKLRPFKVAMRRSSEISELSGVQRVETGGGGGGVKSRGEKDESVSKQLAQTFLKAIFTVQIKLAHLTNICYLGGIYNLNLWGSLYGNQAS